MKRFKKIITALLCLTAILPLLLTLPSCSRTVFYKEGQGELKIVASSFVPFELARNVTNGNAQITLLQSNGSDLHDYTPTAAALSELKDADIFICIGGVTDSVWVSDAAKACENDDLTVIRLSELCEGKLTELEGHSHSEYCEEHHFHDHDDGEHDDHGHDEHSVHDGHNHTADEHIWLSVKNMIKLTDAVYQACASKAPNIAQSCKSNADAYISALCELDRKYTETVAASEKKTAVFADRFPYIYLTDDYGICHYAAFSGCSSETDASFETAVRLTEAVKDNALQYVFVTENTDKKLAQSIASSTGCQILTLNSLQSVSAKQIKDGITYVSAMEHNLLELQKAL